jgi:16S rRNA (adenine1518-N6/adenine1519-N6)-dimethyltransferase
MDRSLVFANPQNLHKTLCALANLAALRETNRAFAPFAPSQTTALTLLSTSNSQQFPLSSLFSRDRIMDKYLQKHHPRKRFGQHFLRDQNILDKIIYAIQPTKHDHILEIGPGAGALTTRLVDQVQLLDVVEIDRDLVNVLQHQFAVNKNLNIHQGDALRIQLKNFVKANKKIRIVGNLPYNISSPLLFHLFAQYEFIQDMHFMLQKEVVERLCASVNSKEYSRLSVMAQLYCNNQLLFTIPPIAFSPPPKVLSAFLRMQPRSDYMQQLQNLETFTLIVKQAFNYRRKTLSNSLKELISSESLQAIGIASNSRPQQLNIEQFIRLSNLITVK